jgi:hypothetical protein
MWCNKTNPQAIVELAAQRKAAEAEAEAVAEAELAKTEAAANVSAAAIKMAKALRPNDAAATGWVTQDATAAAAEANDAGREEEEPVPAYVKTPTTRFVAEYDYAAAVRAPLAHQRQPCSLAPAVCVALLAVVERSRSATFVLWSVRGRPPSYWAGRSSGAFSE